MYETIEEVDIAVEKVKRGELQFTEFANNLHKLLRLCAGYAETKLRRYKPIEKGELIGQCCIELHRLIPMYKKERGVPFLLYAKKYLPKLLLKHAYENTLTGHLKEQIVQVSTNTIQHTVRPKDIHVRIQLQRVLKILNPRQRQVMLDIASGMSLSDIAKREKVSRQAIHETKRIAVEILKKSLYMENILL